MNCHNFSACSAVRCPWSDPGPTRLIPTANLAIPLRAPQPNISSSQVSLVGHPAKQPRWSNGATASILNGGTSTIGAFGLIYGSCYGSLLANGSSGSFEAAGQILNVSTMKALGMLRRRRHTPFYVNEIESSVSWNHSCDRPSAPGVHLCTILWHCGPGNSRHRQPGRRLEML